MRTTQARSRVGSLVLGLAISGCLGDGDSSRESVGRHPLSPPPTADPESGTLADTPDTETEHPPAAPVARSAEALAAGERLTATLRSVGRSAVGRDGVRREQARLGALAEAELRAWFDDVGTYAGTARLAGLEADLRDAAAAAGSAPTPAQDAAIRQLATTALGPIRLRWNGTHGTPLLIEGPLTVARGVSHGAIAASFVESNRRLLDRVLRSDERDTLEAVAEGRDDEHALDSIVFARSRDGLRVQANHVEVFVTRATHSWGQGVVARLRVQWDAELLGDAGDLLDRPGAIALAGESLRADMDVVDASLQIRCFAPSGRSHACRPTWRVTSHSAPTDRADTAWLDASTGEVLQLGRNGSNASGSLNVNSNWPYDAADVYRDFARAELRADVAGYVYSTTDDVGGYDWSTPAVSFDANISTRNWSLAQITHQQPYGCNSRVEVPRYRSFIAGGVDNVSYWVGTNADRTESLVYQWLVYLTREVAEEFYAIAEIPTRTWFDAALNNGGVAGQVGMCGNSEACIGIDAGDDTGARDSRDITPEEFVHTVQWCTEQLGSGCEWSQTPADTFDPAWEEGQGHMIAGWFTQYDNNRRGAITEALRTLPYMGPNVPNDIFVHDSEIEGTPTIGSGCNPLTPGGYSCEANEACWYDFDSTPTYAHDRPRCMLRGTSEMDCRNQLAALGRPQPPDLVEARPYGRSPSETNVSICVHNNYAQGRVFANLAAQLFHTAGYWAGVGAMLGVNRDLPDGLQLTQGPLNFFDRFLQTGHDYEVSDAFHTISTETFAWFDDATNVLTHAEVIRTPRPGVLTFVNGGPTGTPLAFDTPEDVDFYLLLTDRDTTYRFAAQVASGSMDLCVHAYDWVTGTFLGSAAGCWDGLATTDAVLDVATGTRQRIAYVVSDNLDAATPSSYRLTVDNLTDDFPSALADSATAAPMLVGQGNVGYFDSDTDADIFRYDIEPGQVGAITFRTGPAAGAALEVYASSDEFLPTPGSLWATGTTNVTFGVNPSIPRYYLVMRRGSRPIGDQFWVLVDQVGCSGWRCNERGTYAAPRPLPSPIGGHIRNAIDQRHSGSWATWANCADGETCDWYGVQLAAGERLTATLSEVYAAAGYNCGELELAVVPPTEQLYWSVNASSGGVGYEPAVLDRGGSMESYGSQLTFVARRAGYHRIRIRQLGGTLSYCPRYVMTVTHGATDPDQPFPIQ